MAMKTYQIRLQSMEDAKVLNAAVCSFPCDADLRQGRYVVDARSILGILSLNFGQPMLLDVYDPEEGLDARLAPFLVK
ncbi:MAG: HPr family phosphocarrier protein [Eubacteriales bacterium]|nr:HPr family phosphocarrier protein [Eubacteriales bacterium]